MQLKIIAKRRDCQTFDEVMEYLVDLLFNRDPVLQWHVYERLTRAVLFYSTGTATSGRSAMLRPTKHSHLDRTAINVALLLLARLKARRVDEYDVLCKFFEKSVAGDDVLFFAGPEFPVLDGPH